MKKLFFKLVALVFLVAFISSCNEPLVVEQFEDELELKSASTAKTSYIVVINDAELNLELSKLKGYEKKQLAVNSTSAKILKRAGITDGDVEHVYGTAIKGFSVKIPPGQLKKLENDPAVVRIEEDQIMTLDYTSATPDGDIQVASEQETPWGITRVNGGADATGKTAWIIDTGIDFDHPDLYVDQDNGASFILNVSPNDDNGHGTHVAGTVAAINNDIGVIGVAAGATVIPVKVLDSEGSGSYTGVIAGIDYVLEKGTPGDVANMSLSGGFSQTLNDAVIAAADGGILFSLAAGNDRTKAIRKSPASAEHENIYTISAMDDNDIFAYFSNYGNPPIDYCAPGVNVYSTFKDGGYTTYSGTSMAAPHVAGILLLGEIATDGYVLNDRDRIPDPIAFVGGGTSVNNPPTADFTYSVTDLTVNFTDASDDTDGTVDSRSWDFGDGNNSTDTNPIHTYTAAGTFSVTLTVTDDEGLTDDFSQEVIVTSASVNLDPVADFTFIANDLLVDFTDRSIDADGSIDLWNWDFGDGTGTSTSLNPSYTFAAAGTYNVTLTVTDNDGASDSFLQKVMVVGEPTYDITLTAVGAKNRGVRTVSLSWEGTNEAVDIYRDGEIIQSNVTGGSFIDDLGRTSGTFKYKVCVGTNCSNEVTVIV